MVIELNVEYLDQAMFLQVLNHLEKSEPELHRGLWNFLARARQFNYINRYLFSFVQPEDIPTVGPFPPEEFPARRIKKK